MNPRTMHPGVSHLNRRIETDHHGPDRIVSNRPLYRTAAVSGFRRRESLQCSRSNPGRRSAPLKQLIITVLPRFDPAAESE